VAVGGVAELEEEQQFGAAADHGHVVTVAEEQFPGLLFARRTV
jgi:hypothetical protein